MTTRDTQNPNPNRTRDPPLPDCAVVRPHSGGDGATIDKSVVEAALDEADHGLVPDTRDHLASDDLLDALANAFDSVTTPMSRDIVADRREAASAVRRLRADAVPVHVTRRRR